MPADDVKSVGIVGGGVVGVATARAFVEFLSTRVYDVVPERSTHSLPEVLLSDVVFVCLPTPQAADGLAADVSAIDRFFADPLGTGGAPEQWRDVNFVLRSTVPVGTTRRLVRKYRLGAIVHSPEFLTARCSLVDAMVPSRMVVGAPVGTPNPVADLYRRRWPHVPLHVMRSDESEALKLIQNSFFAVKVAFWNETRAFCDAAGLDWMTVLDGILADGRIHPSHTRVPGQDGLRGFGGNCLPKDLANLITCIEDAAGCSTPVLRAALERNKADRLHGKGGVK